ncbi:MAG: F0F1 ATP synthase subunit A [Thermaerobacter sp.]|jgi:F-type H+-transporting ATPase subunit a|nr:F0F1 ATP synthase subunit A [Thermaerobacter sp.]
MSFSWTGFYWPPFFAGLAAMVVVLAFGLWSVRRVTHRVPGPAQNLMETAMEAFENLVGQTARPELAPNLTLMALTMFLLLVVSNIMGLLPLPGFDTRWIHSPTADLNMPAGLAVAVFLLVQWSGIKYRGLKDYIVGWFWRPIPIFGFFVNALEQLVMPVSLSFRIFGNILAGEIVLRLTTLKAGITGIKSLILVAGVGTAWLIFSNLISLIQALIFTILTVAYMSIQSSTEH